MEGLRGFAVFLVFCVHYCTLVNPWIIENSTVWHVQKVIFTIGHSGVDLFFVLSGYLIYGTIIKSKKFQFVNYIKRRVIRIYPTFLVLLTVYLILSFLFPLESKLPQGLLDSIIYIFQNIFLLPGLFNINPIVTVAWSLSYEFLYYLMIPLVVLTLKLKTWSNNSRIFFWLFITVFGFIFFTYLGWPIRLLMFISGIVVFELHYFKKIKFNYDIGIPFLTIGLLLFGLQNLFEISHIFWLAVLFVLYLVVCLESFHQNTTSSKWFSLNPLRRLGNMSYSFYLIHGLTLKFFFLYFTKTFSPTNKCPMIFYLLWIIPFFLSLISSFCLFILIERPLSLNRSPNRLLKSNIGTA
jgi:peptidoglycan/LPS O-acetylase OafA/YrhL